MVETEAPPRVRVGFTVVEALEAAYALDQRATVMAVHAERLRMPDDALGIATARQAAARIRAALYGTEETMEAAHAIHVAEEVADASCPACVRNGELSALERLL